LAVRIPKSFAEEVGLQEGTMVSVRLSQGGLVIELPTPRQASLEELIRRVRKANLQPGFDAGPAQGREVW